MTSRGPGDPGTRGHGHHGDESQDPTVHGGRNAPDVGAVPVEARRVYGAEPSSCSSCSDSSMARSTWAWISSVLSGDIMAST